MNVLPRLATVCLLATLALSACATLTPYQPMRDGHGYSEQQLEPDRYRVTVAGSSATPRQTVENYLLYRAAELTLAANRDYFILRDQSIQIDNKSGSGVSLGIGGFGFGSSSGMGVGVGVGSGGNDKRAYKAQAEVVMKSGTKPADDAAAFDARAIKANLESLVVAAPAR